MEVRESPSPPPRRKVYKKHDGLITPRLDVSPSSSLAESDTSSSEEVPISGTPRRLSPAKADPARLSPGPPTLLRRRSTKSREGSPDVAFPPTYIVIRFASDIREPALAWLIDKIRGQRRDGGAELLVRRQPFSPGESVILHISASKIKFLEVAEEMELKKKDKAGLIREFTVAQMEDFMPDSRQMDSLLSTTEKQTIVRHELENIRALTEDHHVPGYPAYKLYEGQSIIQMSVRLNLIESIYPLHERVTLEKLGQKWYKSFSRTQPFEEIRLYFGEAVALYFNFLGFYTLALVPPMILGILQLFLSTESLPFFCVFNVLWVTIFLEVWKRKCNALAFSWGTLGMTKMDEPRPNYYGHMEIDEITGRYEPHFPKWKTYFRMYCISMPIVGICMGVAFVVMLASFWAEEYMIHLRKEHLAFQEISTGAEEESKIVYNDQYWTVLAMLPSVIYAAIVFIMNTYYRYLATMLTEWENHRTQAQFERHRVTKLVLFEFVNNFVCMFYIAFYIQDMDMLRQQLAVMLIILQAINNIQEAFLPLIIRFYTQKIMSWIKPRKNGDDESEKERLIKIQDHQEVKSFEPMPAILKDVRELSRDDPRIILALEEGEMDLYEGTYDDYLELFIQFGYVFLFSSVYPLAAFWAVVNNILEIRSDAFKLCKVYQRPMVRRVKDTGAWQRCFEAMGAISVMTNCGLLCLSPRLRKMAPELSGTEWVLLFVGLEHALLFIRHILNEVIPDEPEWVRIALAKIAFQSRQALKHERLSKSKKQLTRKYKSVHGPHKY